MLWELFGVQKSSAWNAFVSFYRGILIPGIPDWRNSNVASSLKKCNPFLIHGVKHFCWACVCKISVGKGHFSTLFKRPRMFWYYMLLLSPALNSPAPKLSPASISCEWVEAKLKVPIAHLSWLLQKCFLVCSKAQRQQQLGKTIRWQISQVQHLWDAFRVDSYLKPRTLWIAQIRALEIPEKIDF